MGMAVRFSQEAGGAMGRGFHGKEEPTVAGHEAKKERAPKYLRSWGNDYPYLREETKEAQRWLPVPEDSEVQRFMRNPHKIPQFENA